MRILSAAQTREVDRLTSERQGITSLDLMERAGERLVQYLLDHQKITDEQLITIFCGSGNNGGDGLVMARLLAERGLAVQVWQAQIGSASPDNTANRQALPALPYLSIQTGDPLPVLANGLLIDALFGAGLNRPIENYWADLVQHINTWTGPKIAIDLPSGIPADEQRKGAAIQADLTLCIELPKLAVFMPENAAYIGRWTTVNIDLDQQAIQSSAVEAVMAGAQTLAPLLHHRGAFDHKGTFGHAAIVAGSYGKMGACLLAARGALRSGAGLVSIHIPACGYEIMQMAFPEAMAVVDEHQYLISRIGDISPYQAIGVGPGLGQNILTENALEELLRRAQKPMVIDADALNILSRRKDLQALIPANSILTPHPKEFERWYGQFDSHFRRSACLQQAAQDLDCIFLLKGGYTFIASPDRPLWINPTGNPGMATGGSGDVLTGILTGLLAQGYAPYDAARLGVYLHGMAGDLAAKAEEQEAVIASDIIAHLGKAFHLLRKEV